MRKNIAGYKKKPSANPTLHEGLLLLVYEYLKTQTREKSLGHSGDASEDIGSSNFYESKEIQSLSLEEEDNTPSTGKKPMVGEKISSSTSNVPSRRAPVF